MFLYPTACSKPATVPGSIDRSIHLFLELLDSCAGLWEVVLVSSGIILGWVFVSFLFSWGGFLATLGCQGAPKRGRVEKVTKK